MQRLSKYEKLSLVITILVLSLGILGLFIAQSAIVYLALMLLLVVIVVNISLVILRLERIARQLRKARQEIYQVLYWLNGTDKRTEHQGRKTRDLLRENVKQVSKLIKSSSPSQISGASIPKSNRSSAEMKAINSLIEAERLRFNRLTAILDTQWEVLQEISQDTDSADGDIS